MAKVPEQPGNLSGGDETAKAAGPAGGDGDSCKGVGSPSEDVDPSGEGVDPSGRGGEDCEGVGSLGWRCSFDMATTFLTTTGTATSSCASYIFRNTGAVNTRLRMEKTRRI
jgi:hypothetical protein